MKNKNKLLRIFSFLILISIFSVSSADENCSKGFESNTTINTSKVFKCDTEIGSNFEALSGSNIEVVGDLELGANAEIEGNLIVHGNLILNSNATIGGNLIVLGDIAGGASNIEVKGIIKGKNIVFGSSLTTKSIISDGNVDLGSNCDISNGISTNGYLKTDSIFTLMGNSIIRGDFETGSNFDGDSTIYVYGTFTSDSIYTFEGNKLKVTQNFKTDSNGDNTGRIYIYGTKSFGSLYDENNSKYSYLIGEIDPLLQYNLSNNKIKDIKNKTIFADKKVYHFKNDAINVNQQISSLLKENKDEDKNKMQINSLLFKLNKIKQDSINEYEDLFKYLDAYIENEDFDINKYNSIKTKRLSELKNLMNSLNGVSINTNISHISKKEIVDELKIKIESRFENIKEENEVKSEEIKDKNEKSENKTEETENKEASKKENTLDVLPKQLEKKLEYFVNKVEYSKKEDIYSKINLAIDKAINSKHKNSEILKLIKQYLIQDLENSKILNEVGI